MQGMRAGRSRPGSDRAGRFRSIALGAAALALLAASCSSGSTASATTTTTRTTSMAPAPGPAHPNIVFILTDDLSWNLVNRRFAPHLARLEQQGETFTNYFVADSLCCPSRSTMFTGLFPHDTHVTTNLAPNGGFGRFQAEGLDRRTFAVALQPRGYATSMLGKYLNGYGDPQMTPATAPTPPGWSDWHVSNSTGYAELNFVLDDNGTTNRYDGPADYGVDVLNGDARSFIAANATRPFLVEVATFAPHAPYTPAPRNADDFPGLTEPRDPSFDAPTANPPTWLGRRRALGPKQVANIDAAYRKRAQAVESVDKLVGDVEATLAAEHLTKDTYLVFTSDNGYHLGQHRLVRGKQTAFDTDIRVPLIVAGPGVPPHRTVTQVAQNVDLYPTFVQLAGGTVAASTEGHSLVPLLHPASTPPQWRDVALVEHQGNDNPSDPDFEGGGSDPTTYDAIRISASKAHGFRGPVDAVYVEYQDPQHEVEYYDIAKDPYELTNIADGLTATQKATLHRSLRALRDCHTGAACWSAGRLAP